MLVIRVRLSEQERRLIGRLARTLKKTRSDVIRAAIAVLAEREHVNDTVSSPYERVAHLIGCVKGGREDLSERTGWRFREGLTTKARGQT